MKKKESQSQRDAPKYTPPPVLETKEDCLLKAASVGNLEEVRQCLDAGARPNEMDLRGMTPLMLAAQWGYPKVVNLLLDTGANPDMVGAFFNKTALMFAVQNCHTEVIKVLLAANANPNAATENGETVLRLAISTGIGAYVNDCLTAEHVESVRLLIAAGAKDPTAIKDSPLTISIVMRTKSNRGQGGEMVAEITSLLSLLSRQ